MCIQKYFSLAINLKKTNIMDQDNSSIPKISISSYSVEVVEEFPIYQFPICSSIFLNT